MSDHKAEDKAPRSDFSNSIGKEVEVFLREREKFDVLGLTFNERGALAGRLVGVDRFGLWFESSADREKAVSSNGQVPHTFFGWDEILSVIRRHPAETFSTKKEYRGLRPTT